MFWFECESIPKLNAREALRAFQEVVARLKQLFRAGDNLRVTAFFKDLAKGSLYFFKALFNKIARELEIFKP